MSSVITKLLRLKKKVVTRCRGQHSEPGQTLRQAGNNPESTLTSQVQYRALAIGLLRIISANYATSEHNT